MEGENIKGGKEEEVAERGRRRGAKGKISPCNDHGGEPQKPQFVAKFKRKIKKTVNIAKQI